MKLNLENGKMISGFPVRTSHIKPSYNFSAIPARRRKVFFKVVCCEKNAAASDSPNSSSTSSPPGNKFSFKLVAQSLGDKNWKFNDIDASEFTKTVLLQFLAVSVNDLDITAYGLSSKITSFGLSVFLFSDHLSAESVN